MKTKKVAIRKPLALLLICILLISIAACGKGVGSTPDSSGNSPNSSSETNGGNATDSNPAPGKDTVTIGITADAGTCIRIRNHVHCLTFSASLTA